MFTIRVFVCAVLALGMLGQSTVQAGDNCALYTYRAEITKVYDGDTVTANIDLGFHMWVHGEKLRLYGIDTPEIRSRKGHAVSPEEKVKGIAARDALRELILGKQVILCTLKDKKGKYGRYLARIYIDGLYVNDWLIEQGHAKPYLLEAALTQSN